MLMAGPGAGQDDSERMEALQEGVDSLRAEGDFANALATAKELLAALQSGDDTRPYQIEDAERLVSTLEFITKLSADDRNNLARAAQLGQEYFALYDEDDIVGAASLAREQLEIISTHLGLNHPETAKSMNNLAYLLEELGEYDTVGVLYEEALEIDRQVLGNLHPDVASDLNNLGTFMQDKGNYPASDSMLREALTIYTGTFGDIHPDVAMVYNNLANLFEETGDLAAAEPMFRRSIFIYREVYGSVDEDVATGLHNLAALLARKGEYAEAEALFKETLEIYRELEADFDLALTLNSAASLLHDQNNYAGAEPLYEEALKRFRDTLGDEHDYVAATLNNLAGLYHDIGDYKKAEQFYGEALEIRRQMLGPEHTKVAIVLLNLARNYRDWGRYDDAEPLYQESLEILKFGFGNEHPDVARCLYSMGNYYVATGDYGQAQVVLRESVGAYEASRIRVGEGVGRAVFQQSPYPKLAYTSLELKKPIEAWPAAEKALGRVLAELLAVSDRRELNSEEAARERDLLDEIGAAEDELTAYRDELRESKNQEMRKLVDSTRSHLFELQTDLSAFHREMAGKYPVSEGQSYPLTRIQKAIPERAAIIGWLDVEVRENEYDSWGYVIPTKGSVQWTRVPSPDGDDRPPIDRTRAFRDALVSPEGAVAGLSRDAKALWSERIKPLNTALGDIEHLIVIPSGAMLGIPVEALVDEEGMSIAERYTVSYAPSATVFCWLSEQPKQADMAGQALLVGDPPFCDAHLASMASDPAGSQAREVSFDKEVTALRFAVVRDKAAVASLPRFCLAKMRRKTNSCGWRKPARWVSLVRFISPRTRSSMISVPNCQRSCYRRWVSRILLSRL
jgi:tetratricopeptide (TPR) repeat protein